MNRTISAIKIQSTVKAIAEDLFSVQSETDPGKWYVVTTGESGSCTCPDATYRGVSCKHEQAARFFAWRSGA